ncbi:glycoside hydrolase family 16 protein [Aeromicrobium fastidiosum]|uniref:Glycoside hydrolase family 16 protein n=1 Tax=Aeromicrobium fastidiosum TaxID=52699 RepID=A0A641ANV0_9ACTN|nr:glycoside hydrolase family 16 protein [Aeromicrobium fastidiosum]KAA1376319.1 glycoside hydrolase family 16 protein [Aeromicrobium fastidiosum]MBP2391781.1 beta-glucanase (GH16 family) [Aeromicrobium fastidiosum]
MGSRSRRATVAGIVAVAATAAALHGPAEAHERSTADRLGISTSAASWKPSAAARLRTVTVGGVRTLQIRPRKTSGRATLAARSPVSTDVIDRAGTLVTASARVRSTQPGRRLTLRIMEVSAGRVVASRSRTVKAASRSWRRLEVSLHTTRPGSRIQLSTRASRVSGRHLVRLADVTVKRITPTPSPAKPPPATAAACEAIDYSDPAQGVRTFTDDFSGTSIDPASWRVRDNTSLNHDKAWITKDAVSVHDGYLDITGRRLPQDQWRRNNNPLYKEENAVRDYSTGYVDSIDRFSQRYGHFEVRAWVPSASTMSRGIWPAFWLRADHQPGEIDPMESYGAPTIRSFDPSSSYEWNSWSDTAQGSTSDPVKQKTQGRADVGADKIWQGWHTYGVNWSPTCLRYTYDGRTVATVLFDDPKTLSYFRGPTFADTFHIRLNMQVGSKYWGWADPEHTRSEFSFKIDWVRVHQGHGLTP